MLLAMHCNTLCHHSGCPAECALVTVPGVIIATATSSPLPLAGADVPTALPVQALGMQGHWARPHHCTRRHHCHIRRYVVPVIYVSWHIHANFLAAFTKLVGNMKTMPVAFVLLPSSCTWHRFHIQCCRNPSLCCTTRCNQGDRRTFIVAFGCSLSAMAVAHGILVACCARPQGADAIVVLAVLN
jgi:hypothetical protein